MEIFFKKTKKLAMLVIIFLMIIGLNLPSFAASGKITLDRTSMTMYNGEIMALGATVKDVTFDSITWTSSDKNVATVNSIGMVIAKGAGTATITAKTGLLNRITATCKITVASGPAAPAVTKISLNKTKATIDRGVELQLTSTITPNNARKDIIWTSSNTSVATVTSGGKVKGKAAGTATITAKAFNGMTATCVVTVTKNIAVTSLTLDKTTATINKGKELQLKATIAPSNATNKSVTWTSSNTSVATVTSGGKVKGVKAGTATITATAAGGRRITCKITVKESFHDVAADLKKQIAKADIIYQGSSFDFSKNTPFKTGKIDCSSYVSYVLYEYGKRNNISGYKDNFVKSKASSAMKSWFNSNSALVKNIGNLKTVAKAGNLKAGDILIKNGHVEIYSYTQNNRLYVFNCGADSAIEKEAAAIGVTDTDRNSYTVYRLLK